MVKMKIKGPNRTGATGKTDKAKKSGGTSGASFSEFLTGSDEVGAASAPAGVAGVNMYVALQAAEHATEQEERRRAIVHADDLLNDLEDLRIGLILGSYTKNQLQNMAYRLQQQRLTIRDPRLLEIIGHIELRAAVELAKYEDE